MFWLVDLFEVPAALAADAHAGDVQLLAGRRLAGAAQDVAGHDCDSRCGGARGQCLAAGEMVVGFHRRISGKGGKPTLR